jgi:ketosteroid isomerase-like protein
MTTDPKPLTRQYMERFAARDLDGVMALFHPDAGFEDPVVKRLDGAAAIREAYAAIFSTFAHISFTARNMYQDGNTVIIEFVLVADQLHLVGTDVIEWEAGCIRELRAYLDMPKN